VEEAWRRQIVEKPLKIFSNTPFDQRSFKSIRFLTFVIPPLEILLARSVPEGFAFGPVGGPADLLPFPKISLAKASFFLLRRSLAG
jgi:hypothetical protein